MQHVLLKPLTFSSLAFAHERTCEYFSLYSSRCQPKTTERQTCTPNKHCLPAKLIIIPFFLKESKLRAFIVKSFSAFTEKDYTAVRTKKAVLFYYQFSRQGPAEEFLKVSSKIIPVIISPYSQHHNLILFLKSNYSTGTRYKFISREHKRHHVILSVCLRLSTLRA